MIVYSVSMVRNSLELPIEHRAVQLSIDRQVRPFVRKPFRELLIVVDAQTGRVPGMQKALAEGISVREDFVGFLGVQHVFLNSKVVDGDVEMKSSG